MHSANIGTRIWGKTMSLGPHSSRLTMNQVMLARPHDLLDAAALGPCFEDLRANKEAIILM